MKSALRPRFSIAAIVVFVTLLVPVPRGAAQSRFDAEGHLIAPEPVTLNERVSQVFDVTLEKVEIAPMVTAGEPVHGAWTGIPNDLFDGILARAGIVPGASDPEHLAGRPGFLEFIEPSYVVNAGGSRATFGYFVKLRGYSLSGTGQLAALGNKGALGPERCVRGFILMSYDSIKGENLNAFEVFIFGPLSHDKDSPPLLDGVAVNGNGLLLPEVPLTIARVSNFKKAPPTQAVTPGVEFKGQGCLECHSREADFPQETKPFPWVPGSGAAEKPEPTELARDCSEKTGTAPAAGDEHSSLGGLLDHFSVGVGVGVGASRSHGGGDHPRGPSTGSSPPDN